MALAERMAEWVETWKAQGIQVGVLQGLAQGIIRGKREGSEEGLEQGRRVEALALLECLLMRRFGEVPDALRQRLLSASAEQIEAWFDRAVTESSIAGVFDQAVPPH